MPGPGGCWAGPGDPQYSGPGIIKCRSRDAPVNKITWHRGRDRYLTRQISMSLGQEAFGHHRDRAAAAIRGKVSALPCGHADNRSPNSAPQARSQVSARTSSPVSRCSLNPSEPRPLSAYLPAGHAAETCAPRPNGPCARTGGCGQVCVADVMCINSSTTLLYYFKQKQQQRKSPSPANVTT